MKGSLAKIFFFICSLSICTSGTAKPIINQDRNEIILKSNPDQVATWNRFAHALFVMHKKNLKNRKIITKKRTGGYSSQPKFYNEISYIDKETNNILSKLQWEIENPSNLHLIEVFIYSKDGQVSEDYLAAYLPQYRNAPIQTLVNIHAHKNQLHAYRQFDASGNYIYEQCHGKFADKSIFISIEEDDLFTANGTRPDFMNSSEYKACFSTLNARIEDYLDMLYAHQQSNKNQPTVKSAPNDPEVLQSRLKIVSKSISQEPQSAYLYVRRADIYTALQLFEKAIADYTKAIHLDDSLDDAYFGRGMAMGRNAKLDNAIRDLTTYLDRNPNSSLAFTKRGVRHIWNGNLNSAKADFIRALQLDAENSEAHDDLGVIYAQQNELEKALFHFESATRFDPTYQKAHHNKAIILFAKAQYNSALASVKHALLLDSDNRNSLILKAAIFEAMGKDSAAQALYEEAEFLPQGNSTERFSIINPDQ